MEPRNAELLPSSFRAELAAQLPGFLRAQRWFGGKARAIRSAEFVEALPVSMPGGAAEILLVAVTYEGGGRETYSLPLAALRGAEKAEAGAPTLKVAGDRGSAVFCDALWYPDFRAALLEAIAGRRAFAGSQGEICAVPTGALERLWSPRSEPLISNRMKAEQSNTSVVYGGRLVLKFFRRLEAGVNPDLEIGTFLTEKASFAFIPPVAGRLEYVSSRGPRLAMAILQGYVANQGDAWSYSLKCVQEFWARVPAAPPEEESALNAGERNPSARARELVGPFLDSAQLLGRRTAQLHRALASDAADPEFAPEEFTPDYMRSLCDFMQELARRVFPLLRNRLEALPAAAVEPAREALRQEARILERFGSLAGLQPTARRTRLHGDYHLGQVLWTGSDFVIIDFEGEPARSLGERRVKRSPLRDVAGMLRSFHYAAYAGLFERLGSEPGARNLEPWARWWNAQVSGAFLRAYLDESAGACYLPRDRKELETLLDAYLLEKAVYELGYELNNRPDWVRIPLEGILQQLAAAR